MNGIWVTPDDGKPNADGTPNSGTRGVKILDSVEIYRDGVKKADYGDAVTIGVNNGTQSYLYEDYHSLEMIDSGGKTFFSINDLRDTNGEAEITYNYYGDGTTKTFTFRPPAKDTNYTVSFAGSGVGTITKTTSYFTFENAPLAGVHFTVTYTTTSQYAKAYTIGLRNIVGDIGAMSVAVGVDNNASGYASFASGISTNASGNLSHSEGYGTRSIGYGSHAEGGVAYADGEYSHAEGYETVASRSSSHAEGSYTTASSTNAHAEGNRTVASGVNSHAGGDRTIASQQDQTAIGQLNVEDTQGLYLFIIGNGTADNARSNALTVAWNGNTAIAGTLTQGSDRRLKDHISYLDEDAIEFVRQLKPAHYIKDGADHVGFYAQDVESVDTWNCMIGEMNGYKTLGYTELIAPLVAYCQHLEKRIEELEENK